MTPNCEDERAVSEVVGYILMLTIVFIAIGMVFANFVPAADDAEVAEHTKNTERVFSVLQSNIYEMIENEVPSRGAEMRLKGGTLSTDRDASRVNVTIDVDGSPDIERFPGTGHVSYETDSGTISYEGGAVFRRSNTGESVMIEEPRWRIQEDGPVILPMISTNGEETVGGDQVALMEATRNQRAAQYRLDPANATASEEVELEIDSPNADGWNRYFEELEAAEVDRFDEDENELVVIIDDIDDRTLIYTEAIITVRIK
jgi:flagellin-like protein